MHERVVVDHLQRRHKGRRQLFSASVHAACLIDKQRAESLSAGHNAVLHGVHYDRSVAVRPLKSLHGRKHIPEDLLAVRGLLGKILFKTHRSPPLR